MKQTLNKLFLCIVLGFLFIPLKMSAQGKVTGKIVDNLDMPVPGVAIIIEGTSRGTTTDFDGNFEITASEGDVLLISYIGFKKIKRTVSSSTQTMVIALEEDAQQLDEVVIVGYGTLEKKELTGSQVSLKSEDINKIQAVSFEEALLGKAAGVLITSSQGGPGDAATIQIRGATSINASSAPLYVIDGVEIDGDAQSIGGAAETGAITSSSPLSLVDPNNIESIEILKDANATSIYGSRGANGVVIITTKTGKGRESKLSFDFDATTGVQVISNQLDILGAQEFVDFFNEAFPWDPAFNATRFEQLAFRDNNGTPLPLNAVEPDGTRRFAINDFRGDVFRPGILNKYSLSARTGRDTSWFSANISYTNQEGIVTNTDFERIQASVNVGGNVSDRLQVGFQASGGRSNRAGIINATPDGGNRGAFGVITNLALAPPVQGRFDSGRVGVGSNNILFDENGFIINANGRFILNPITQVNETVNRGQELFGYISTYLDYKLADGLNLRTSLSFNAYENLGEVYLPTNLDYGQQLGIANVNRFSQARWQNNNTLTFDKLYADKHKINVVLGTSLLSNEFRTLSARATGFESDEVNLDDLSVATNQFVDSNRGENGLLGFFGRLNYSFDSRYVINLTARTDKSSRFFPGSTQWGFFPSAGFTWNVSEESFLENSSFLSNLRLKASVGQTGNDKIGVFQSQLAFEGSRISSFRSGNPPISAASVRNGNRFNGFFLSRVSNPDLTWETTTQYDIGGEIGLFNNRINIAADWFRKDTEDLLLERPTASQAGFPFVLENVGEVRNTGLELSFRSVNVSTKNFKWSTNFNISFIENEVISLGGVQEEFLVSAPAGTGVNNDFIVREGLPLGYMFGYESDGVYQFSDFVEFQGLSNAEAIDLYRNDSNTGRLRPFGGDDGSNIFTLVDGVPTNGGNNRPGQQKLVDQNGDGVINEADVVVIGDANPDHFGGMTNSLSYKNWDLSFVFTWRYGGDVYNKNLLPGYNQNLFTNKYGIARERWTPNNQDTRVNSIRGRVLETGIANTSDYIEDGSFLRLQNLSLGYNLPDLLTDRLGLTRLRFYLAADNVFVWTNYSGYDPDVSIAAGTNSALTPAVDFDAYPRATTFRLGIQGTF